MKQFGKLSAFLTLTFLSYRAAAAPILPTAATNLENISLPPIDPSGTSGLKSNDILPPGYRRPRSVSAIARPVLNATSCLTNGLDNGLTQSAGQIQSGVNSAGKALNSVTHGVGDVAAGTLQGAGGTVAKIPKALFGVVHSLEHGHGFVGDVVNTLTGTPADGDDD